MEPYLFLFLVNFLLIFADAMLGHRTVPRLLLRIGSGGQASPVSWILAGMVALYMFFNCLGYFRDKPVLLILVTVLVVAEIAAQLFLKRRMERQKR